MARPVKVDLIADPTYYVRGMRTARRESQQFTDHTRRAGSAVKAAFAAFSAATVVMEMRKWVSAARDANRVAAETDAVIRSTHGAAGLSAKGFADLAKQVMRNTAVDDDLIQSGENMLATFKNIKAGGPDQVFERTTRAAVDLAAGMNQGKVTAGGMQTASIQLGKALNEPIKGATALQRVGIKLDDTQKAQIKTFIEHGQVAKAQGIILAEVESQFKGRAEANATASQRLAVTWGNMQEVLGNLLIPTIDRGATIMANTLDVIDRNRAAFGLLFGVLAGGAAIIGGLIVAEKIHRAVTDATRVATEAWAAIQRGLNIVLGTTTVEASAASAAEGRLAGTTAAAGTAAAGAAPKFAALQTSLVAMSAVGAAAWAVFKEGQETLRLVKGESDTALDPPLLALRGIARTFGFFKDEAKGATDQTGQQAAAAAAAAAKTADHTAAMESAKVKTGELTGKLKELKQGYRDQIAAVRDSIQAYDGLIAKSDVTASEVIGDLHNQVANFKTYSADVHRLIKAGVNPAAIEELSKKGPQYIHALATGSNRQLQIYKGYWRDRQSEVKGGFAKSMQEQYEGLVKKIKAMQREINRLKGKNVDVTATTKVDPNVLRVFRAAGGVMRLSSGGHLPGYGGGDRLPVLLEAGETVVSKEASRKPYMQAAFEEAGVPGYTEGGIAGAFPRSPRQIHGDYVGMRDRASAELVAVAKIAAQLFGGGSPAIKAFIRSTDALPYIWGGAGPGGYDCSGIVSAVLGKMTGRGGGHGQRYFTTGTIHSGILGIQPGLGGTLQIGVTPARGHMVGRYGGLGFEAESTRTGIKVGSAATRPESMARHYHHMARGGLIDRELLARFAELTGADIGGDQGRLRINGKVLDAGGWLMPGQIGVNLTRTPERVLGPGEGATTLNLTVNVHNHAPIIGSPQEFARVATSTIRSELKSQLRREGKIALAGQL